MGRKPTGRPRGRPRKHPILEQMKVRERVLWKWEDDLRGHFKRRVEAMLFRLKKKTGACFTTRSSAEGLIITRVSAAASPGRPLKYPFLETMEVGQKTLIRWERPAHLFSHKLDCILSRLKKRTGKRFVTLSSIPGLTVIRME